LFSLNPYRGCEHGCIYCYARTSHEYLGFSAGLDFETKIMVKTDAPGLLANELPGKHGRPQPVALSGNTGLATSRLKRTLRLTRRCLEVFHRFGQPGHGGHQELPHRTDIDLLAAMARRRTAHVLPVDHHTRWRSSRPHDGTPYLHPRQPASDDSAGLPTPASRWAFWSRRSFRD